MKTFKFFPITLALFVTHGSFLIAATYPSYDYQKDINVESSSVADNSSSIPDKQLIQRIRYTIENNKTLSLAARRVNIEVKDSRVTLTGAVSTSQEMQQLETVIRQVKGVQELDNNVHVIPS